MWQFWSVLIAVAALPTATWATGEEDEVASGQFLGSPEISCGNLTIIEYADNGTGGLGPGQFIPFDMVKCRARLSDTPAAHFIKPTLELLSPGFRREVPDNETKIDYEKRIQAEAQQLKNAIINTQQKLQPLYSLCDQLGGRLENERIRSCYFGGPVPGSGGPFKAAFGTFVKTNGLNEVLCAKEPLAIGERPETEFSPFLSAAAPARTWQQISQSLQKDGFNCREGDFCNRVVWSILISSMTNPEIRISPGSFALPRLLNVYQGEWRAPGRPSLCMDQEAKAAEPCKSLKPVGGAEAGICLGGGDSDWLRVSCLFNDCPQLAK
jgi:hypothetical protein